MLEIGRELGVVEQIVYCWHAKYAGMEVAKAKHIKELEAKNGKLKNRVTELMMDRLALKEAFLSHILWHQIHRESNVKSRTPPNF